MKQCKVWEHGAAFYEAVVSRYSGRGGSLGALCHDLFTPLQDRSLSSVEQGAQLGYTEQNLPHAILQ